MTPETRQDQIKRETKRLRVFQGKADDITSLITDTDLPWVDVAIQVERLRLEASRLFPSKTGLFDLIYISRFHRLWRQWRPIQR